MRDKYNSLFGRCKKQKTVTVPETYSDYLRKKARNQLKAAYAAIPDDLHVQYPLLLLHKEQSTVRTKHCHKALVPIGRQLGPGFPRVVSTMHLNRLKAKFRSRYCNPDHELYPKIMEVRSSLEAPPPHVGSWIEVESLVEARVIQVGHFKNLQAWQHFPFWGKGGVACRDRDEIHTLGGLSKETFEQGKVWWALLEFPN